MELDIKKIYDQLNGYTHLDKGVPTAYSFVKFLSSIIQQFHMEMAIMN